MKVTADTNILLRVILHDDIHQAAAAQNTLQQATLIAITLPTLCEVTWVMAKSYRKTPREIQSAIETLLSIETVAIDRAAAESGLAMLASGGDFADGVIAHEGRRLGGGTYLTFDKRAARLIEDSGRNARLLLPAEE